jgi:alpha-glucosidase
MNRKALCGSWHASFAIAAFPCDVIHLDIDYMNGYRVFTWSPKRFAEPAKLIRDLKETGFQVVTIVDPGVKYEPEADYAIFDDGLEDDYFVRKANGEIFHGYVWPDKAVFPDFLKPEVRHWWGDAQKALDRCWRGWHLERHERACHRRSPLW